MRFLPLRWLPLGLAFAVGCAACGQKGPLYLRDNPPPGVKPAKPPAAKPVPYPDREETK